MLGCSVAGADGEWQRGGRSDHTGPPKDAEWNVYGDVYADPGFVDGYGDGELYGEVAVLKIGKQKDWLGG
jgi:hypothetical protein